VNTSKKTDAIQYSACAGNLRELCVNLRLALEAWEVSCEAALYCLWVGPSCRL